MCLCVGVIHLWVTVYPCPSTVYCLFCFPSIPLFFLKSPSVANPACACLDNKLSGERRLKVIERNCFFLCFFFLYTKSNVHIRHTGTTTTTQDDSHGTLTLVGPVMRHDILTLRRSKNLSVSVCLWVKSLTAKWIILQLLLHETHIILRLSSPHYIHKSPNLFHTAVKKIIITIETHLATSKTPLPFILQIPSTASSPFYPPRNHFWDTTRM